jgi:3-hydroxyacyl-[acyl-carrier-protein] dehydratase
MEEPSRAFSFVDRVVSCKPGGNIRGRYRIPSGIDSFPLSLVAEAVGQLAAWSAMAAMGFQRRPVAGIAGGVELLAAVHPGQTLELAADLETADAEAVAYDGSASVDGVPVLRLTHCVGPMVPMAEFDDPATVQSRFGVLCGAGAASGGFNGLPPLRVERTGGEAGKTARATLHVPSSARIFADHFPRRPVFPGSLLMHANLELASQLVRELPSPAAGLVGAWQPRRVSDMKLRAFIPPGEILELEARLEANPPSAVELFVETRRGKRLLGNGRLLFVKEGSP